MRTLISTPVSGETELEIYHHELEKSLRTARMRWFSLQVMSIQLRLFLDRIADIIRWDERRKYDVHEITA